MSTDIQRGDKVRYKAYRNGAAGTVVHVEDNVAVVKFGWQDNRLIKLSELAKEEQPKPEPFKPGWYQPKGRTDNFTYYVAAEFGGRLYYTHAYNPKTGEMDAEMESGKVVIIGKALLDYRRGDLIRCKFVREE